MKKIITLIISFLSFISIDAADKKVIPLDSICQVYNRLGNVYTLFDVYSLQYKKQDIVRLSDDEGIKNVLKQLLSREHYKEYVLGRVDQEIKMANNNLILNWFSSHSGDMDSILANPELKRIYMDSAYAKEKDLKIKSKLEYWDYDKHWNSQIQDLLHDFRCQELYDGLYALWEKHNKSEKSELLEFLLYYHDPEAVSSINKYFDECAQKNQLGNDILLNQYFENAVKGIYGSWTQDLRKKALTLDFYTKGEYSYEPLNLWVVKNLAYRHNENCDKKASKFARDIQNEFVKKYQYGGNNSKYFKRTIAKITKNADMLGSFLMCVKQQEEQEEQYWKSKLVYFDKK